MFVYFYLTIAAYYILKTVRNAYFVDRLGADSIPWVKIAIALLTGVFVYGYSRIARKVVLRNLINGSLFFLVAVLMLFWWVFDYQARCIPFLFFMWITLFNSITVTQFWTFTSDLFDAWEAKRVFGLVGTGGLLGGMSGSYIASNFAAIISTRNLLLVASGIVLLCVLIVTYLWQVELTGKRSKSQQQEPHANGEDSLKRITESTFELIGKSRYLFYLMLLVGVTKFATELTEWQLNKMAEIHVTTGLDGLTEFFGAVFGGVNTVALIVQIFGTSFFLRKCGGANTLLFLPGGLLIGSLLLFFFPAIWSITVLKILDGSLRYSIYQSAKEYVYLPVNRYVRYKIKPFIDMFIYQFAKGLGGLFVLVINGYIFVRIENVFPGEQTKVLIVSVVVFAALIAWFVTIHLLRREYPNAVRNFLQMQSGGEDTIENGAIASRLRELRSAVESSSLPKPAIREAIEHEIKEYRDVIRARHLKPGEGPLTEALKEKVLSIFNLLSFIYKRNDMVNICHYYLTGDEYVRAHAMEMLELTVDIGLRRKIISILDGKHAIAHIAREAAEALG